MQGSASKTFMFSGLNGWLITYKSLSKEERTCKHNFMQPFQCDGTASMGFEKPTKCSFSTSKKTKTNQATRQKTHQKTKWVRGEKREKNAYIFAKSCNLRTVWMCCENTLWKLSTAIALKQAEINLGRAEMKEKYSLGRGMRSQQAFC